MLNMCGGFAGSASARAAGPPAISAGAAILIEADTGALIYGDHQSQRRAIASTTKLMTAYVTLTHSSPERILVVQPYTPAPEETVAGLVAGQRLSVRELLEAMLLPSAGDAANTLAVDLGNSVAHFVGWMNTDARALGLRSTHYSTPVGLDTPGNYSTAADLAHLARVLMRDPIFARIVDLPSARLGDGQTLLNRNDLVGRFGYMVGVKTGHTAAAGYCLVGAARARGATVISVVLGESGEAARDRDTLVLLRYGLESCRRSRVITPGRVYASVPVQGEAGQRLALVAAHPLAVIVRSGTRLDVYARGLPAAVSPSPAPGTPLGEVVVRENGRIVAHEALVAHGLLHTPAQTAGVQMLTSFRRAFPRGGSWIVRPLGETQSRWG